MITLFVETGIQYVDIEEPLDFQQDSAANAPHAFEIGEDGAVSAIAAGEANPFDEGGESGDGFGGFDDSFANGNGGGGGFGSAMPTAGRVFASAADALETFARQWIPVPYNSKHPFWVRVFLEPTPGPHGEVYRAVLACDTHTRTDQRSDELGLLRAREVGQTYAVDAERREFWEHPEVAELARNAWRHWRRRQDPQAGSAEADSLPVEQRPAAAVARLWALVRFLAGKLPEIQITMGTDAAPVDAHLVLDLGNCRTAGTIVETPGKEGPFFAALELRSHELPARKHAKPFETRMEFVRTAANGSAQGRRFDNISLIRLGEDALEAASDRGVAGVLTGMSSPKRYLWDATPRPADWCFNDYDAHGAHKPIAGDILRYIDPDHPFSPPEVSLLASPPCPRYSRKTGLVFVLAEILEQAFAQMNSPAHRGRMPIVGGQNRRRVFRSVVLVHPSGMTTLERRQLQMGAQRAVDIWFDYWRDPVAFRAGNAELQNGHPIQPKPKVQLDCDEGTAVQICYLYGEVQARYQGDADGFFRTCGSVRNGEHTLRLASLDVGGGTTDLVISEYKATKGVSGFTCLDQTFLFRDGISLGGDDVARALLTGVIFPAVCEQFGINAKEWQRLFSPTRGSVDPEWESVRRQLVPQLWVPLARYYWGWAERGQPDETITLGEVFQETHYPTDLIKRLNAFLAKLTNGAAVDLSALQIDLNAQHFNDTVRKVLNRPLYSFCDIIAQFGCDLMVVAGRAAGLPELMRMLVQYCPLPPARIASLQGYPIEGSWFPFARDGVIADAKSCVVVGAAVHHLATTVGGQFIIRPQNKWGTNTVIGIAQPLRQTIRDGDVLFHPRREKRTTEPIVFGGQLWLGCRNIDDERAYANALYEIDWVPGIRDAIRDGKLSAPMAEITLAQDGQDPFKITVQSAKPQAGLNVPINRNHVAVKLHTIYSDDYWLDTGCFYD